MNHASELEAEARRRRNTADRARRLARLASSPQDQVQMVQLAKDLDRQAAELEAELDLTPIRATDTTVADTRTPLETARANLLREKNFNLADTLKSSELAYIDAALHIAHGNVSQAAKLLGVNRTTLYGRMEALGRAERVKDEG